MNYFVLGGGRYAGKTSTIEYLSNEGMAALPELRMSDAVIKAEEKRTEKVDALCSRASTLLAARGILSATLVSRDIRMQLRLGDPEIRKRAFEYGLHG